MQLLLSLSLSLSLNSAGKVNVLCGLDRSGIDVFIMERILLLLSVSRWSLMSDPASYVLDSGNFSAIEKPLEDEIDYSSASEFKNLWRELYSSSYIHSMVLNKTLGQFVFCMGKQL
jgi:hypothetical protein